MKCDEALRLLDDAADAALSQADEQALLAHCAACDSCRREAAAARGALVVLAAAESLPMPRRAMGRALAAAREAAACHRCEIARRRRAMHRAAWLSAAGIAAVAAALEILGVDVAQGALAVTRVALAPVDLAAARLALWLQSLVPSISGVAPDIAAAATCAGVILAALLAAALAADILSAARASNRLLERLR